MLIEFRETGQTTADEFLAFASSNMDRNLCKEAKERTRNQGKDVAWHEMRYGRITASKICERGGFWKNKLSGLKLENWILLQSFVV